MPEQPEKAPTYVVEAIPTDFQHGLLLGNPAVGSLVGCVIAMGAELWATQRRMKVIEALLARQGITPAKIEEYMPSEAEKLAWERDRDRFVAMTMGPFADDEFHGAGSDFPWKEG